MADTSHVLARKYRPQVFSDLIGQDTLVQTITNAIAKDRLAHAYILTGIRGIGKTSSARIIAKGLNCIGPDGKGGMTPNPCGKCQHCIDIANDSHIDVIEIDAASNTGVDNIREIIESAKYNPVSARFKVYIIDEVHMLSKPAFNALLKTLEEPPERIKFILATTEIKKVPITILSRCQRFDLKRISEETLYKHLEMIAQKENISFEPNALKLIARAGDGSVRDSLSLMDQAISQLDGNLTFTELRNMLGIADRSSLFDLFEESMKGHVQQALAILNQQYTSGVDPVEVIQDLLELTHWITKVKIIPSLLEDETIPETERTRGKELSEQLSMATLTSSWQILLKGMSEIKISDLPFKTLEMILIRLAFMTDLPSPAEMLEDIKKNTSVTNNPALISAAASRTIDSPRPAQKVADATQVLNRNNDSRNIASNTAFSGSNNITSQNLGSQQTIQSLSDIVSLARAKGERMLAFQIETALRPIEITPGLIKCVLNREAGRDLVGQLSRFLTKETQKQWIIQTQINGGGQTLQEIKEAKQNALLVELKKTPIISSILKSFPGSKIEKVKPIKQEERFESDSETDSLVETEDDTTTEE